MTLTDELVCFTPSLDGCRQERMSKSKGSCSECIDYIGIDIRVVSIPVSLKIAAQSNKVNSRYSVVAMGRQCSARSYHPTYGGNTDISPAKFLLIVVICLPILVILHMVQTKIGNILSFSQCNNCNSGIPGRQTDSFIINIMLS